jgi:hypothetical protein
MKNVIHLLATTILFTCCGVKKEAASTPPKATESAKPAATQTVATPKPVIKNGPTSVQPGRSNIEPVKAPRSIEVPKPTIPNQAAANKSNALAQGKSLYETKCNTCHAFKNVKSRGESGWQKMVYEMSEMSNREGKPISTAEQDLILAYLVDAIKE